MICDGDCLLFAPSRGLDCSPQYAARILILIPDVVVRGDVYGTHNLSMQATKQDGGGVGASMLM